MLVIKARDFARIYGRSTLSEIVRSFGKRINCRVSARQNVPQNKGLTVTCRVILVHIVKRLSQNIGRTRSERTESNFEDVFVHVYIVCLTAMVSFVETGRNKHRDHRPYRWPESCTRSRPSIQFHPCCVYHPAQPESSSSKEKGNKEQEKGYNARKRGSESRRSDCLPGVGKTKKKKNASRTPVAMQRNRKGVVVRA